MDATIRIKNYKLHKDLSVELKGGNIYFVSGKNGVGKSSFIQALLDLINATSSNKQKLTNNTQNGFVSGTFNLDAANGEVYQVIMDYKLGGPDKFTLIRPDNSKSNKKADITDIFKYNSFTIEEFFGWGLTAEGRRKQAAVFLKLLSDDQQALVLECDKKANGTNGELFMSRRDMNRDLERYDGVVLEKTITAEEKVIIDSGEEWKATNEELKQKKIDLQIKESNQSSQTEKNSLYESTWNNAKLDKETHKVNYDLSLVSAEKRVTDAKQKLAEEEASLSNLKTSYISIEKKDDEKITIAQTNYNTFVKEVEPIDITIHDQTIIDNDDAIEVYEECITKSNELAEYKALVETEKGKIQTITTEIEDYRKKKEAIISTNISVKNIKIEDGELFYIDNNNIMLPFNEKNISYSAGGIIVFELMALINRNLNIWLIGKAGEYDDDKIAYMLKRAKELDGIIIADYVDKTQKEFKIEVFDETRLINN